MKSQQWRILKNPHLFIARAYGERTVPVLLLINIFPKQQQQQPQNNNKPNFVCGGRVELYSFLVGSK